MLQFRQSEIEQLRAHLRQHDIAALEITMRHAVAVGRIERARDFNRDLQRLLQRQRAFLQFLRERLAFQKLHHQEVGSVLLTDVVENANVGMLQAGYRAGFAFKPLARFRRIGQVRRQDFDRHRPVEPRVPGL